MKTFSQFISRIYESEENSIDSINFLLDVGILDTEEYQRRVDTLFQTMSADELDKVTEIQGNLELANRPTLALSSLTLVRGNIQLFQTGVKTLPKLKEAGSIIGDIAYTAPNLEKLGSISMSKIRVKNPFPNLERIGNISIQFASNFVLPNLKIVESSVYATGTALSNPNPFPSLVEAGTIFIKGSKVETLPSLRTVKNLYIAETPLLDNLLASGLTPQDIKRKFGVTENLHCLGGAW
jgi:hypothetical protein